MPLPAWRTFSRAGSDGLGITVRCARLSQRLMQIPLNIRPNDGAVLNIRSYHSSGPSSSAGRVWRMRDSVRRIAGFCDHVRRQFAAISSARFSSAGAPKASPAAVRSNNGPALPGRQVDQVDGSVPASTEMTVPGTAAVRFHRVHSARLCRRVQRVNQRHQEC